MKTNKHIAFGASIRTRISRPPNHCVRLGLLISFLTFLGCNGPTPRSFEYNGITFDYLSSWEISLDTSDRSFTAIYAETGDGVISSIYFSDSMSIEDIHGYVDQIIPEGFAKAKGRRSLSIRSDPEDTLFEDDMILNSLVDIDYRRRVKFIKGSRQAVIISYLPEDEYKKSISSLQEIEKSLRFLK